jgi:hypothetical protein
VNASGSYTVVSNVSGCASASSAPAIITYHPVPPVPTITPSGPTTFCQGGQVNLQSSSSLASDQWSTGTTGPLITVSASNDYTVTTTNGFGCTSTSLPLTVTVNPLPNVVVSAFDTMCDYVPSFGLTNGTPIGGTYIGTGVVGNIFIPSSAGTGITPITYIYTDPNGCTGNDSEDIVVEDCAGIEELASGTFAVYPNPSLGYFTITSTLLNIDEVKVYDATGKVVSDIKFNKVKEAGVDLLLLADGVYHAEIIADGRVERVQLVVNK